MTVTLAFPLMVPFVAVTLPGPGIIWAVSVPLISIEPTLVAQTNSASEMTLLYTSYAMAVNVWIWPTTTVDGSGVTMI